MIRFTDKRTLNNGYGIPCIGFGTWQTPDGESAVSAVKTAIECGYRHIDTAAAYGNEESVGTGIREGLAATGLRREDLFVTSKVWNEDRGYKKTKAAFEKTMRDLGLEYLDLYLIHWPTAAHQFDNWEEINRETWQAMSELHQSGKVKAIGLSNFFPHHMRAILEMDVKPAVNQIEFHPGQMQSEVTAFCEKNNILIEAWSPLGTGKMLENPKLKDIANKYNRTVAQLCIRWCLQNNALPLPKSITPSRIKENTQVFDFTISENDMRQIDHMEYCGGSGLNPDEISF